MAHFAVLYANETAHAIYMRYNTIIYTKVFCAHFLSLYADIPRFRQTQTEIQDREKWASVCPCCDAHKINKLLRRLEYYIIYL